MCKPKRHTAIKMLDILQNAEVLWCSADLPRVWALQCVPQQCQGWQLLWRYANEGTNCWPEGKHSTCGCGHSRKIEAGDETQPLQKRPISELTLFIIKLKIALLACCHLATSPFSSWPGQWLATSAFGATKLPSFSKSLCFCWLPLLNSDRTEDLHLACIIVAQEKVFLMLDDKSVYAACSGEAHESGQRTALCHRWVRQGPWHSRWGIAPGLCSHWVLLPTSNLPSYLACQQDKKIPQNLSPRWSDEHTAGALSTRVQQSNILRSSHQLCLLHVRLCGLQGHLTTMMALPIRSLGMSCSGDEPWISVMACVDFF